MVILRIRHFLRSWCKSPLTTSHFAYTFASSVPSFAHERERPNALSTYAEIMSQNYDDKTKGLWVDCIFLFSMVWTVGACTDAADRPKFDFLMKKLLVCET